MGIFPDLLKPKKDNRIVPVFCQYRSLWIDFPHTKEVPAGIYPVKIVISSGEETVTLGFLLEVLAKQLPPQKLIHTQWFHADCLADFYLTEVFSYFHGRVSEKQIKRPGVFVINML